MRRTPDFNPISSADVQSSGLGLRQNTTADPFQEVFA